MSMMRVDCEILPISLPFLPSKQKVGQCGKLKRVRKESALSTIISCHLSARSELGGESRENEHVTLAHADTTGAVHSPSLSLPAYLFPSLSLSLIMAKLAQKSDPFRTELNKKLMCTVAFQGDPFKIGHTEFISPKLESLENNPVTIQAN